jgi:hypothetical protein
MQTAKQTESVAIDKSPETDIERNVHELKHAGATFRQTENSNVEMAVNNLATLLDWVSDVSTREIDNLIGELRVLREKLEADRDRIQGDVAEYAALSQAVMRLTANISDSVDSLPSAPSIVP